jgi:alkanesulfonate monooxygenase SsuD/methylene tetrahydromethanopterin reductase-like flavin-dependent oxidoreductase (luciferase family)
MFEGSVPRPFNDGVEKQVFDNIIEQVKLADQLGFSQVWAVEHHFLEEYAHCSAPEMLLTAVAMVTEHVRVGHGIVCCVPEYSHPVRIAERAAMLDILSGGRADIGTGRSGTWTELGGMGANPDITKASWDEYVRVLPKMWMQETFSWQGEFFSMPERAILPKPVQKPHPPMYVAVITPGTELEAADRGLGALGVTIGPIAVQEAKAAAYRKRIQSCDPVGGFVNEHVDTVSFLYCHEDLDVGAAVGGSMVGAFTYASGQAASARHVFPTRSYSAGGLLEGFRPAWPPPTEGLDEYGISDFLCIGDPDRIIKVIKRWESAGIDRLDFLINTTETIPQEAVLESLRLFSREVMPAFGVFPPEGSTEQTSTAQSTGGA